MKKSILSAFAGIFLLGLPFSLWPFFSVGAAPVNDPGYAKQLSMWNSINASAVWGKEIGSRRVVVAIIDTGVDSWHPDLSDNIWTNPYELAGNGVDDDHNGYVDDIHGWNFVENNNDTRTSVFNKQDLAGAVDHGTLAAGLIGAIGNNGLDGAGINWQVSIMPLRAVNSDGSGSVNAVDSAIYYAVDNGADVISLSLVTGNYYTQLYDALNYAYKKGVVVVASAGNDSANLADFPNYPACIDDGDSVNWVLGVGALAKDSNKLADFSDYGSCVDIVAPGEAIYSTERYAPTYGYPDSFGGPWDGTSFSAPLVAGTAALIKSIHPEWRPDKIISIILKTATNIDADNLGRAGQIGAGKLNLDAAVARARLERGNQGSDLSSLYFIYEKSSIVRFDLGSNLFYLVDNSTVGEIIDLSRQSDKSDGREFLAGIIHRSRGNFLRIWKDDGRILGGFALSAPAELKKSEPRAVRWRGGNLAIEWFDSKLNTSVFIQYDQWGKKIGDSILVNKVLHWDASGQSGNLVVVIKSASGLKWQFYDSASKLLASGNLSDYQTVDDLRLSNLWVSASEQVAFLVKNHKNASLLIIDPFSNKSITEAVGDAKPVYGLVSGLDNNKSVLFVYDKDSHDYKIYSARGVLARTGKIK